MKKRLVWLLFILWSFPFFRGLPVLAYSVDGVVINEIAWAGTQDGSNDEWMELYNNSNEIIDLSGWSIVDDASATYKISVGEIGPHDYFLIEDSEQTVDKTADALIGLSLANAGDSLVLKDGSGKIIDEVNSQGGAWFAGNSSNKASMERVDPALDGDQAGNWKTAISGNGAKGKNGSAILGTPGTTNSTYGGEGVEVFISPIEIFANPGSFIEINVKVDGANDLYAYGLEINYPEKILSFVEAFEGELLKVDGTKTAFAYGIKDGKEGSLLLGNARLLNPAKGVDGAGNLLKLKFKVIAKESDSGEIKFGASSFFSNSKGDVLAKFNHADINVAEPLQMDLLIANLKLEKGDKRYSLKLSWQEDLDGANHYIIKKKMPDGSFVTVAEVADPYFVDSDEVKNAGKIVPGVEYSYQVIGVMNDLQGEPLEINGSDDRGVKGDNDRNDVVDGRDVERLARSFGSEFGDEEYDQLKDTNFDGVVDGGDLIDIGINFGMSYKG